MSLPSGGSRRPTTCLWVVDKFRKVEVEVEVVYESQRPPREPRGVISLKKPENK